MKKRASDPARIYVAWHPSFGEGWRYAGAIYRRFCAVPEDIGRHTPGLPVFYRTGYAIGTKTAGPPGVDPTAAETNIIIPLVDEHFVTDVAWRTWLVELKRHMTEARAENVFYPVPFHDAAVNLPSEFTDVNFLRVDQGPAPINETAAGRFARRNERLLNLLTEALCRLFLSAHGEGAEKSEAYPQPVTLFVSHAKADGREIGERLRDEIHRHGQIKAFFDENDLAVGFPWRKMLDQKAGGGAAALVAVMTDAYAGRPWCLREIREARKPRQLIETNVWRMNPAMVLDALETHPTRCIPELGAALMQRYHPDRPSEIIGMVMMEVLRHTYNLIRAKAADQAAPGADLLLFNAVPEPHELMDVFEQRGDEPEKIIIPGAGLNAADIKKWRLFTKAKILTLDDIEVELCRKTVIR